METITILSGIFILFAGFLAIKYLKKSFDQALEMEEENDKY